jgi:hypothetical protein
MSTPARKNTRDTIMTGIRPKMWLKDAKLGWSIADASRKDVPDQKASSAEPFSLFAMMGKATDRDVPSKATVKAITIRAPKASHSRVVGFHFSSVLSSSEREEDADDTILGVD